MPHKTTPNTLHKKVPFHIFPELAMVILAAPLAVVWARLVA